MYAKEAFNRVIKPERSVVVAVFRRYWCLFCFVFLKQSSLKKYKIYGSFFLYLIRVYSLTILERSDREFADGLG